MIPYCHMGSPLEVCLGFMKTDKTGREEENREAAYREPASGRKTCHVIKSGSSEFRRILQPCFEMILKD